MPQKPIKRGLKIWALCCSANGYLLNFNVYTGKKDDGTVELSLGEKVILEMSQHYAGKNYCLYFDNYFNSITLADKLLTKQLFSCGTIRADRKYYPKGLMKIDKEMQHRDFDFIQSGNIGLTKWKGRGTKCVSVLSTIHDPSEAVIVERKNHKEEKIYVDCPKMIACYNKNMGGVDLFDQHISYYSMNQKSRRWWVKIFLYLLESCVVNSYILYKMKMQEEKKNLSVI